MTLSDQGRPTIRTATQRATVTITVTRNQFDPLFFNATYYTTILESVSVGTSVMTVSAQDPDTNVRLTIKLFVFILQPKLKRILILRLD